MQAYTRTVLGMTRRGVTPPGVTRPGVTRQRVSTIAVLAVVGIVLPVLGAAPVGAATVPVALDCGPYDGTTFPVADVTVAQGDTIKVTWDAECIHPSLHHTVLRTDADVANTYFSSVPGQGSGPQSGQYVEIVPGSSSGSWVVRYDAPLGQMPLNTNMDDSWPVVCSNCAEGGAIRLTITPGPTVPDAPAPPTGTPGHGSVKLSWSAPGDDGGSPITGYTVTAAPGGAKCTTTAPVTSCKINGLTNGEAYSFRVLATNAVGDGAASATSAAVTPLAIAATTTSTTTMPNSATPTTTTPTTATQPLPVTQPVAAPLTFAG